MGADRRNSKCNSVGGLLATCVGLSFYASFIPSRDRALFTRFDERGTCTHTFIEAHSFSHRLGWVLEGWGLGRLVGGGYGGVGGGGRGEEEEVVEILNVLKHVV